MKKIQARPTPKQIRCVLEALSPTLLFSLAMLLVTGVMVADALSFDGHRGPDPEQMLTRLTETLDLSEDQLEAVRPILETQVEMMHDAFSNDGLREDRNAMRAQMEAIREETEFQLETILTPQQMDRYRELAQKRQRRFKNRM